MRWSEVRCSDAHALVAYFAGVGTFLAMDRIHMPAAFFGTGHAHIGAKPPELPRGRTSQAHHLYGSITHSSRFRAKLDAFLIPVHILFLQAGINGMITDCSALQALFNTGFIFMIAHFSIHMTAAEIK